ncbi:hypothetical protein GCM10025868_17900 [Angustibacter aerolatus]|uniref:histidine kinase n=1 Tax=Angustibacter aerolatus TaxID=1162965 RepID=A0ABQ6JH37_9ACTN|nr:histidine kinase dimerization/phosphoacceptor domain-containing protein [Angustibacter aerolatus]GMA86540.1 hypothetical protein GCM10025868_17900 [Angustibacter aerolatus]
MWLPALAATAIAFGTAGETYDVARTTWGPMPFVGAIVGLPLLTVVSRPLVGWAVSAVAAVLLPAVLPVVDADPWRWQTMHGLVLLALLLAVCAREPLRAGAGAWLVTLGLFLWGTKTDIAAAWVVPVTVVAVIGWLVGRLVRARRALSVQAEVSSAEKARRLVLEERQRIARDLHDVVAHHMSLVVVQAETAPYRVPGLDDGARTEPVADRRVGAGRAVGDARAAVGAARRGRRRRPDAAARHRAHRRAWSTARAGPACRSTPTCGCWCRCGRARRWRPTGWCRSRWRTRPGTPRARWCG